MDNGTLYTSMVMIRRFEETVLENFSRGVFSGTTHTYLGQEANAVGVLSNIQPSDVVISNHRCHGHYLACGGDPYPLFAELMGKATGVSGGRGGSQHLHWGNFYSNGVLGGMVPIATGMALAEKRKSSGAVALAFLGDGALGEGVVYEFLNIASLWGAPILYVLENNRIAQTTPIHLSIAGDLSMRFEAFGIPTRQLDSSDVCEIQPVANEMLADIRSRGIPGCLILHTFRFGPHSKGDDTRSDEEISSLRRTHDPLAIHAIRLVEEERKSIHANVDSQIEAAFQRALQDNFPTVG